MSTIYWTLQEQIRVPNWYLNAKKIQQPHNQLKEQVMKEAW